MENFFLNFYQKEELPEETKFSKDIQINNFTSIKYCKESRTCFVVNFLSLPIIFCVSVYPNGVSLQTDGCISVQFHKLFIDTSDSPYVHDALWIVSIVDVNGQSHYCQSFTSENITGYPYNLIVPKFMKRSVIEDDADILLPDDVLTLRCELSYISKREVRNSYSKSYNYVKSNWYNWYLSYNKIYAKEMWKSPLLSITNFNAFHNPALIEAIKVNINHEYPPIISFCRSMDTLMEMFLKNILIYISFMNLSELESQLDLYAKSNLMDEFCDAYIPCNCIFQTYIVCKQTYRKELNKVLLDKSMLKPGYIFFFKWLHIPLMKMKEKYLYSSDVPLSDKSQKENYTQLSLLDERCFIEEVVDTSKMQSLCESFCNGWNCIRDAFTYLLIDEDMLRVSENVLRYPVRDYRVTAIDMACQINFLHFLHDGNIQTKSMATLCKLYEMAEDYNVLDLRYLCAQSMESSFTKDNIDSVKKIRHERDYYLKAKIDSFERKISQNEEWFVN